MDGLYKSSQMFLHYQISIHKFFIRLTSSNQIYLLYLSMIVVDTYSFSFDINRTRNDRTNYNKNSKNTKESKLGLD